MVGVCLSRGRRSPFFRAWIRPGHALDVGGGCLAQHSKISGRVWETLRGYCVDSGRAIEGSIIPRAISRLVQDALARRGDGLRFPPLLVTQHQ